MKFSSPTSQSVHLIRVLEFTLLLCFFLQLVPATVGAEGPDDAAQLIEWLLEEDRDLTGIPFTQVIEAVSGKSIVPVDAEETIDKEIVSKLGEVMDKVLARMNDPENPVHDEGRINEASSHFENALLGEIDLLDGFECDYPRTAAGRTQRTGYSDLKIVHKPSGRVVYLDPKLYAEDSRTSSLRTFYFTPRKETNKVLEDAHHLLVGFAHSGKTDGHWTFTNWELIDLSHFEVRLKAEFQGSNRDLYKPEAVVGSGEVR